MIPVTEYSRTLQGQFLFLTDQAEAFRRELTSIGLVSSALADQAMKVRF